jgi:hypothetical protein
MNITMVGGEVIVTGGVEPYDISIEITGNVQTVTVIDFDGCEATAEFPILGISEELLQVIIIYPNPASTEIHIDVTDHSLQIETLQMIAINGQLIKQYQKADRILDVNGLSNGIYILKIEFADGAQINKRVIVLR